MIKQQSNKQGFTIVELLIVIVVIGILAAITIVAYNGITARANTAKAQSAANMLAKKAEAYAADDSTSGYPTLRTNFTSAATTTTYFVAASSFTALTTAPSATTASGGVTMYTCGASVGNKFAYWDAGTSAVKEIYAGSVTSTTTGCTISAT